MSKYFYLRNFERTDEHEFHYRENCFAKYVYSVARTEEI